MHLDFIDKLSDEKLDENIHEGIKKNPGCSFAELERLFPTDNPRQSEAMYYKKEFNLIMWITTNTRIFDSLDRLQKSKKIFARGCAVLFYVVDGMMLQLPIAKSVRKYKKDTWIPMLWETWENRQKFVDAKYKEF